MKSSKTIHCIQLKDEIQQALLREYEGMTDEQRACAMEQKMASSDSPVAKLWYELASSKPVLQVAEPRMAYRSPVTHP